MKRKRRQRIRVDLAKCLSDWDRIDDEAIARSGGWIPRSPDRSEYHRQRAAIEVEKLKPTTKAERLAMELVLGLLRGESD